MLIHSPGDAATMLQDVVRKCPVSNTGFDCPLDDPRDYADGFSMCENLIQIMISLLHVAHPAQATQWSSKNVQALSSEDVRLLKPYRLEL